ncbi:hypothetical protein HK102_007051, partial [Quaeritorhiza haematococci]
ELRGFGLRGTIDPVLWAGLTSLTTLVLSANDLTGVVPGAIAKLPALTLVDLSDNSQLGGQLSSDFNTALNIGTCNFLNTRVCLGEGQASPPCAATIAPLSQVCTGNDPATTSRTGGGTSNTRSSTNNEQTQLFVPSVGNPLWITLGVVAGIAVLLLSIALLIMSRSKSKPNVAGVSGTGASPGTSLQRQPTVSGAGAGNAAPAAPAATTAPMTSVAVVPPGDATQGKPMPPVPPATSVPAGQPQPQQLTAIPLQARPQSVQAFYPVPVDPATAHMMHQQHHMSMQFVAGSYPGPHGSMYMAPAPQWVSTSVPVTGYMSGPVPVGYATSPPPGAGYMGPVGYAQPVAMSPQPGVVPVTATYAPVPVALASAATTTAGLSSSSNIPPATATESGPSGATREAEPAQANKDKDKDDTRPTSVVESLKRISKTITTALREQPSSPPPSSSSSSSPAPAQGASTSSPSSSRSTSPQQTQPSPSPPPKQQTPQPAPQQQQVALSDKVFANSAASPLVHAATIKRGSSLNVKRVVPSASTDGESQGGASGSGSGGSGGSDAAVKAILAMQKEKGLEVYTAVASFVPTQPDEIGIAIGDKVIV